MIKKLQRKIKRRIKSKAKRAAKSYVKSIIIANIGTSTVIAAIVYFLFHWR